MPTLQTLRKPTRIRYPTTDGKPMAETDKHRINMTDTIDTLSERYRANERVYVSGNMLVYYVKGNPRKHVAPDVFAVFDVPKHLRPNYLVWKEGKSPDVIFEFTSKSTRKEDLKDKYVLYRDTLKVREYFLFDPFSDYLDPPLQGHRLNKGIYDRIEPVEGRLPSEILGLHLERAGWRLRFFDPAVGRWLPIPEENQERLHDQQHMIQSFQDSLRHTLDALTSVQEQLKESESARREHEKEKLLLQRELEALRRRGKNKNNGNQT